MIDELRKELSLLFDKYERQGIFVERVTKKLDEDGKYSIFIVYSEGLFDDD